MALTILNNISSLSAENALSNTQANLQKTLTQLSTGLKINSGSDDAAGLSFATGMQANVAALTQSQQNASNGIGLLQTADGALSQVTTLLNRAVTLATEGATSGVTTAQASALNNEFTSILAEVNQIGQTTNFNGQNVFTSNTPSTFTSAQGSLASPLSILSVTGTGTGLTAGKTTTITETGGKTFSYTAKVGDTAGNLINAINNAAKTGVLSADTVASMATTGPLTITAVGGELTSIASNDTNLTATSTAIAPTSNAAAFSVSGTVAAVANSVVTSLTNGSTTTIHDSTTGGTFVFKAGASDTLATLNTALANGVAAGTLSTGTTGTINASGQLSISNTAGPSGTSTGISVTTNDAALGAMSAVAGTNNTSTVFISDGSTAASSDNTEITTVISALSSTALSLNNNNLNSAKSASDALTAVNAAISTVSAQRGVIGASVNRLTAASSVMSNAVTNLTSGVNSIQNADIGKTVANMTQYNVLQSTGMAALQQSNQAQQAVLKLVQ